VSVDGVNQGFFMRREHYLFISIFCVWEILGVVSQCDAQMSKKEALTQFVKAGYAYKQENYTEAIALYGGIIEQGLVSGPVYYNLANSYFKTDNMAKAILNYERAKRLMPRDSDLKSNLNYARSLIKRPARAIKQSFIKKIIYDHFDLYSLNEITIISLTLFIIVGLIGLVSLHLQWPKKRMRIVIIVLLASLLIFYVLGGLLIHSRQVNKAVVLSDTDAKFEPRDNATVHFSLYEGSTVTINKKEEQWLKVIRADGLLGWVRQETVEEI
jgi:tetratricopeptide (TPR) repeat protein